MAPFVKVRKRASVPTRQFHRVMYGLLHLRGGTRPHRDQAVCTQGELWTKCLRGSRRSRVFRLCAVFTCSARKVFLPIAFDHLFSASRACEYEKPSDRSLSGQLVEQEEACMLLLAHGGGSCTRTEKKIRTEGNWSSLSTDRRLLLLASDQQKGANTS